MGLYFIRIQILIKSRGLSSVVTRNVLIIIIEDALHIDDVDGMDIKKFC